MKKRLFALGLALTMVFSVGILPVLADELDEDITQQEEINEYQENSISDALPEEFLPEDVLDEGPAAFADDEEVEMSWQEGPVLPIPRVTPGAVTVNNKIYVMGGWVNSGYASTNSLEIYDVATGEWSTGANMPAAARSISATAVDGKIYAGGGGTALYVYTIANDSWATVSLPGNVNKFGASLIAVDKKIYFIGGTNQPALMIYDTVSEEWTNGASIPTSKNHLATAYYDGKIYAFGGRATDGFSTLSSTEIYDIATDTWATGTAMPVGKTLSGYVQVDNIVWIVGGASNQGTNTVHYYNLDTDVWTEAPALMDVRWGLSCVYVDGVIYAIGGMHSTGGGAGSPSLYSGIIEILTVKDIPTPPTTNRLYVLLNVAESVQLSLSHNLGINLDYDWRTTDQAVATVNANGYVTAEGEGTCFIYAENEEGYRDFIPIKVVEGNADEIRLAVHLTVGGQAKLYLAEDPGTVNWISFDSAVATVDNEGVITAHSRGLVIIQGELDGEEYHIYVRVNA